MTALALIRSVLLVKDPKKGAKKTALASGGTKQQESNEDCTEQLQVS